MVKHGYPELAEHVAIHQQLSVRATELAACCRAGHCEVGDMFEYLAQELVFRHILGADRKLAAYLAERQPPAA
jgi:hemerythrin